MPESKGLFHLSAILSRIHYDINKYRFKILFVVRDFFYLFLLLVNVVQ